MNPISKNLSSTKFHPNPYEPFSSHVKFIYLYPRIAHLIVYEIKQIISKTASEKLLKH